MTGFAPVQKIDEGNWIENLQTSDFSKGLFVPSAA